MRTKEECEKLCLKDDTPLNDESPALNEAHFPLFETVDSQNRFSGVFQLKNNLNQQINAETKPKIDQKSNVEREELYRSLLQNWDQFSGLINKVDGLNNSKPKENNSLNSTKQQQNNKNNIMENNKKTNVQKQEKINLENFIIDNKNSLNKTKTLTIDPDNNFEQQKQEKQQDIQKKQENQQEQKIDLSEEEGVKFRGVTNLDKLPAAALNPLKAKKVDIQKDELFKSNLTELKIGVQQSPFNEEKNLNENESDMDIFVEEQQRKQRN